MNKKRVVDFRVSGGGTIYLVEPVSDAAKEWVKENVPLESWQWLGPAFAVEHRYITDLLAGIRGDGLAIEGVDSDDTFGDDEPDWEPNESGFTIHPVKRNPKGKS